MPSSIQFNEYVFLTSAVLALAFIVYGLIQASARPPDVAHLPPEAPSAHWMAHRQETASVCAEEQAEQIIEAIWPQEEVL